MNRKQKQNKTEKTVKLSGERTKNGEVIARPGKCPGGEAQVNALARRSRPW